MLKTELLNSIENPDVQLAAEAQGGDVAAEEALIRKYSGLVRSKTKAYFIVGADSNDVMQEGMIGLMKAVRNYNPEKEASFGTFADLCVTRQILSAIKQANRVKHVILNEAESLEEPIKSDESRKIRLGDTVHTNPADSPEEIVVLKDVTSYILNNGDNIFSDFEWQVVIETIKGYSVVHIAERLGKSVKQVDNALQRAKKKVHDYLWK